MVTLFQEERNKYKPVIPQILRGIKSASVRYSQPTSSLSHAHEIAKEFPGIFGRQICHFSLGFAEQKREPLRVGVFFSGGQASGGHNVIAGLFDALKTLHPESRLFGFLAGPSGLVENRILEITEQLLAPYRNSGGFDLLGSGRTKIEKEAQFVASFNTVVENSLDALVVIGGDDSNTNAAYLAEYFIRKSLPVNVIGIPKTIDGDLKNHFIESSFGFDTASKVYSELISNIARDAISAKKYCHFVKLMGRTSSHIALECALKTHPNLTLIGEEIAAKKSSLSAIVSQIADLVVKRAERGKNYGVFLLPEGILEFVPEMSQLIDELNCNKLTAKGQTLLDSLPKEIAEQLQMDRDPHGNVRVSQIETEKLIIALVEKELKGRCKFSAVGHFMGYEGRSAPPSNFDANYTYSLGMCAALLIDSGCTGYMAMVNKLANKPQDWEVGGIPLTMMMAMEKRKGELKAVVAKSFVDLKAEPFLHFSRLRDVWALEDLYQFQGPIQYFGPSSLTDEVPLTLKLEQNVPLLI